VTQQHFRSLDLLATAVVVLDQGLRVVHCNQAAEALLGMSNRGLAGALLSDVIEVDEQVEGMLKEAAQQSFEFKRQQLTWRLPMRGPVELDSTVSVHPEADGLLLSLELREIAQQRRADREEHLADLTQANKELMRNLAHEIKKSPRRRAGGCTAARSRTAKR